MSNSRETDYIVVLDLETTGLDRLNAGIVGIGAVWVSRRQIPPFAVNCRPRVGSQPISDETRGVNGCDWENDPTKPTEEEAILSFLAWLRFTMPPGAEMGQLILCGWNVGQFDYVILERAWQLAGMPDKFPFDFRVLDLQSVQRASMYIMEEPTAGKEMSLARVCDYWEIPREPKPHTAQGGAEVEAELARTILVL